MLLSDFMPKYKDIKSEKNFMPKHKALNLDAVKKNKLTMYHSVSVL